jgi:hypothetical protein
MEPERRRVPRRREVVFRVLAERSGHLEAQAVGAAFSAGVTLAHPHHRPDARGAAARGS